MFDSPINPGDYKHRARVERNEPTNVGGVTADNWVAYTGPFRVARKSMSGKYRFKDETIKDFMGEVFYCRRFSAGKRVVPGMRLYVYDENAQTEIRYRIDYVTTPNSIRLPWSIHATEEVGKGGC